MSQQLVAVTFNTYQTQAMVAFYKALGCQLQGAVINKGGQVHRGLLANVEVILRSIETGSEKRTPRISFRFELTGIQEIYQKVLTLPGVDIMMELADMPSGKSFIAIDPDGHSIEIFERWPVTPG